MIFEDRKIIFLQIAEERAAQDEQWGGHDHDAGHTNHEWLRFIHKQCERAWDAGDAEEYRKRLIKIAALAVAAIEATE